MATSACRERPVRSTLSFNTLRENNHHLPYKTSSDLEVFHPHVGVAVSMPFAPKSIHRKWLQQINAYGVADNFLQKCRTSAADGIAPSVGLFVYSVVHHFHQFKAGSEEISSRQLEVHADV